MKKLFKILLIVFVGLLAVIGVAYVVLDNVGVTYELASDVKENLKQVSDYKVKVLDGDYEYTTLKKTDGSDIRVMALTDTHFDHKEEKCTVAYNNMLRNIIAEKPDLIVFVGDNITSVLSKNRLVDMCEALETIGIYWTCVLGNHEGENPFMMRRQRSLNIMSRYNHCLVDASVKRTNDGKKVSGVGNHVINLANNDGVYRSLFLLDGGMDMSSSDIKKYSDEVELYKSVYDYVKESQIKWYEETVKAIKEENNGVMVKSTIFCHIPLCEFQDAWNNREDSSKVTNLVGIMEEGSICCPGHNTGFLDRILEIGSTDSFYSGHDHVNNFVLDYTKDSKTITFGYVTSANYSSYNLYTKGNTKDIIQGYGIIEYTSLDSGHRLVNYFNQSTSKAVNTTKLSDEELKALYGEFVLKK